MGGNIWYILHRLVLFHLVSFDFWGNIFLGVSILTVSSVCFSQEMRLGPGQFFGMRGLCQPQSRGTWLLNAILRRCVLLEKEAADEERKMKHNLDNSRVHFYSCVVLPGNIQGFMGLQWDTPSQRIVTRRKGGCWIGGLTIATLHSLYRVLIDVIWCHLTCSFFTNGFCVIPTKMTIWKMAPFATINFHLSMSSSTSQRSHHLLSTVVVGWSLSKMKALTISFTFLWVNLENLHQPYPFVVNQARHPFQVMTLSISHKDTRVFAASWPVFSWESMGRYHVGMLHNNKKEQIWHRQRLVKIPLKSLKHLAWMW